VTVAEPCFRSDVHRVRLSVTRCGCAHLKTPASVRLAARDFVTPSVIRADTTN